MYLHQGSRVLEVLDEHGDPLPGTAGRHLNPGHAIEAGWFLLDYWKKHDPENKALFQLAVDK